MQQDVKIEDLVEGSGKAIERGALITVHYRGYLDDGTEFDSSHKNNAPFQVVLSNKRVIQGWILGLAGMKEGGKRKLWVPASLAYGERQIGNMIPPHSDLTFEIELFEVLSVAYLLYLAYKIATSSKATKGVKGDAKPMTFIQAVMFQWVNPKAWTMALTAISVYAPIKSVIAVVMVACVFGAVNFQMS